MNDLFLLESGVPVPRQPCAPRAQAGPATASGVVASRGTGRVRPPTRRTGSTEMSMSVVPDKMDHMTSELVGRDAELEQLRSTLGISASAPASTPPAARSAVLLAGDAGVGKTRLLTELRDRAVADGWLVQAGHCLDFADSALPYLPFSEITGRIARELPDLFDEVAARHPALLAPAARPADAEPGRPTPSPSRPTRPPSSRPSTPWSRPSAPTSPCSSSSRTCTGPTSRPATC